METLTFSDWSLIIAAFSMVAVAAIGIYQALFVHPQWFINPPASLQAFQQDKSVALWVPLQGLAVISLLIAALTHSGMANSYILVAIGGFILTWILTLLFFIPGVIAFRKVDVNGPASPELKAKGQAWLRKSSIRLVILLLSSVCLLIALAL